MSGSSNRIVRTGLKAALLVVLSALPSAILAERQLPGAWLEAKSDHFVVVGNASEKKMREAALHFEQVRAHYLDVAPVLGRFAAPPLRVYLARDARTMALFMPSVFGDRSGQELAGRFVDRPTMQFIEAQSSADRRWRDQVVAHEYFHYLANRMRTPLPVWLDEGLAEFWGATEFTPTSRRVGRLIEERLAALRGHPLIPLDRLFVIDRRSPEYRSRDLAPAFYAESWLLVHYLKLADGGERDGELRQYVKRIAEGAEPLEAAREAFGDLRRLERGLSNYAQQRLFPLGEMTAAPEPDAGRIAVRHLTDAEAGAAVALALLHSEPPARSRPLVEAARAAEPARPAVMLASALLAIRERRYGDAQAGFEEVNRTDGREPLSLYGAALTRLYRDRAAASFARSERDLRDALAIDPEYSAACARLADTLLRSGGDLGEALALVRRAEKVRPEDSALALREAEVLLASGRKEEGDRLIEKLTSGALGSRSAPYMNNLCWYGALFGFAPRVLPLCEKSLEIDPANASALDSRGLARAITGDLAGAAADFEAAIAAAGDTWSPSQGEQRRTWIHELREGRSPFEGTSLLDLLYSPEDSGGWGY